MKRDKIIKIVVTIVLIVVVLLIVLRLIDKDVFSKTICDPIDKLKEQKENFVIILNNENTISGSTEEAYERFEDEYANIDILKFDVKQLDDPCFNYSFAKENLHNEMGMLSKPIIVGYKDGKYVGEEQNSFSFFEIESYLDELGVIKKKEIVEKITYDEYKQNILRDDYIITVIMDENARIDVTKNMKKVFPDIKQDVINMRSETGKKIFEEIESQNGTIDFLPVGLYFRNGKLIASNSVYLEYEYAELKDKISNMKND